MVVDTCVLHRGEEVFHKTVARADHLQASCVFSFCLLAENSIFNVVMLIGQIMLEKIFLEMYCNSKNFRGMTPLHVACYENLTCSHEDVIRCLLDEYGCDSKLEDNFGKLPYDYLVLGRGDKKKQRSSKFTEKNIPVGRK
jgi:hypothetical protein